MILGNTAVLGCSGKMRHVLWRSLLNVLFIARCVIGQPKALLLDKYNISHYSEDRIFSSVIWLMPPYCMYEAWMRQALDTSVAPRSTSLIEVQVQIMGNNGTFIVPDRFNLPQCSVLGGHPPTELYMFQVGPDINNQNGNQVIRILPETSYTIRFVLYNANTQIAYTNWSQPFETRGEWTTAVLYPQGKNENCSWEGLALGLPPNPRELSASFEGRSGGMVVITVLLSISMFILLVGLAIAFGTPK